MPKKDIIKESACEHALDMSISLGLGDGQTWLDKVYAELSIRIDYLVAADAYCQGIMKTLDNVNMTLKLGEKKAEQLMGNAAKHRR